MNFIDNIWLNSFTYIILPATFLVLAIQGTIFRFKKTVTGRTENIGLIFIVLAFICLMLFLWLDFFVLNTLNVVNSVFNSI